MQLYVVVDHAAVRIFNRFASAREALALASQRRLAGAEAVFVYDSAWTLIEAPDLDSAVRREAESAANKSSKVTTFTLGSHSPERSGAEIHAQGRVRVFRGRGTDGRSRTLDE